MAGLSSRLTNVLPQFCDSFIFLIDPNFHTHKLTMKWQHGKKQSHDQVSFKPKAKQSRRGLQLFCPLCCHLMAYPLKIWHFRFKKCINIQIIDSTIHYIKHVQHCLQMLHMFDIMDCEVLYLWFISWLFVWCQSKRDNAVRPSSESIIGWSQL